VELASATITFFPDRPDAAAGAAPGETAGSAASLPPLAQRKTEKTVKNKKIPLILFITTSFFLVI
jgi:hypothetical protein